MKQEDRKFRKFRDGSGEVIAALLEVHSRLGAGLLESTYEACFCQELALRSIGFERQRGVAVEYRGLLIDCGYRIDVLVGGWLVVELKSVEHLLPVHTAQVLTYLKLAGLQTALLVNFNVPSLRDGIRRLTLRPPAPS